MTTERRGREAWLEPEFNLLLVADPFRPQRYRIEGSLRMSTVDDPYEALRDRLDRLIQLRRVALLAKQRRSEPDEAGRAEDGIVGSVTALPSAQLEATGGGGDGAAGRIKRRA